MLDKSVPYVDFYMRRKAGTPIPVYDLPDGYKFTMFRSGDEQAWAEIETSVLEFDDVDEALTYYKKEFLPYKSALEERCLFIENEFGEKVATSTAWWCCKNKCNPWVHWVAVKPQYQGLGLGKAVVSKIVHILKELDGDKDFYLHTQTWSHKAVKIYEKIGFNITDEDPICVHENKNYGKALSVLNDIYHDKLI